MQFRALTSAAIRATTSREIVVTGAVETLKAVIISPAGTAFCSYCALAGIFPFLAANGNIIHLDHRHVFAPDPL
jgi:hypothetical protein